MREQDHEDLKSIPKGKAKVDRLGYQYGCSTPPSSHELNKACCPSSTPPENTYTIPHILGRLQNILDDSRQNYRNLMDIGNALIGAAPQPDDTKCDETPIAELDSFFFYVEKLEQYNSYTAGEIARLARVVSPDTVPLNDMPS